MQFNVYFLALGDKWKKYDAIAVMNIQIFIKFSVICDVYSVSEVIKTWTKKGKHFHFISMTLILLLLDAKEKNWGKNYAKI